MLYTVLANSVNGCIVQRTWTSLILRLQHPWLKWCHLLLCTNCQNHWVLCYLMWEGSYWLVTCGWPCALSPVTRESTTVCAPQIAAHTQLSKHVLFLVSLLFQPWVAALLPYMTMVLTSIKCFWIHGWVPWTTPRQASGSGSRVITCQSNIGDR